MSPAEIKYRLSEIAATNIQDLSDEAVLALLQERKKLTEELAQAEAKKKEAEEAAEKARIAAEAEEERKRAEQQALEAKLTEINKDITPDQDDEKLLKLIQERKKIEAELEALTGSAPAPVVLEEVVSQEPEKTPVETEEEVVLAEEASLPEVSEQEELVQQEVPVGENEPRVPELPAEEEQKEKEPEEGEEKVSIRQDLEYTPSERVSKTTGKVSAVKPVLGEERIEVDDSLQTTEFQGYLSELKDNLSTLGSFLQALPKEVKRNRAFMLEVAKVDPAYAMHYADKDTLKKDESFNVAIARMNNQRNTGNALSEMLPEMRTGQVVLEGVKNDFRNVRFARPEMAEYEEIIHIAQKGTLEAMQSLKDAHDIKSFVPPILQKDKAFMIKVQNLTL